LRSSPIITAIDPLLTLPSLLHVLVQSTRAQHPILASRIHILTTPELALGALASHLLALPNANAAVVDTTGTFDVLGLHDLIASRIRRQKRIAETRRTANAASLEPDQLRSNEPEIECRDAGEALDRVKIMRVFDFVGVVEALGEVREEVEAGGSRRRHAIDIATDRNFTRNKEGEEALDSVVSARVKKRQLEIADSEDEDEDMLFGSSAMLEPDEEVQQEQKQEHHNAQEQTAAENGPGEAQEGQNGRVGMTIIDNFAHVAHPLLKGDYVQGLLAIFLTEHPASCFSLVLKPLSSSPLTCQ
jgi:hypothetical protein